MYRKTSARVEGNFGHETGSSRSLPRPARYPDLRALPLPTLTAGATAARAADRPRAVEGRGAGRGAGDSAGDAA